MNFLHKHIGNCTDSYSPKTMWRLIQIHSLLRDVHQNRNNASSRTGCQAKIRLLRRSDHSWYIAKFNNNHNHRRTESYNETKQWGSHGHVDPTTKTLIAKLRENNVCIGKICNILEVADSCTRKQSVRSVCAKISRQNIIDDLVKTMDLLNIMKCTDPGLEVRFQIDSEGTLRSMLWCTGKKQIRLLKIRWRNHLRHNLPHKPVQPTIWSIYWHQQPLPINHFWWHPIDNWKNMWLRVGFYNICGNNGWKDTCYNAHR